MLSSNNYTLGLGWIHSLMVTPRLGCGTATQSECLNSCWLVAFPSHHTFANVLPLNSSLGSTGAPTTLNTPTPPPLNEEEKDAKPSTNLFSSPEFHRGAHGLQLTQQKSSCRTRSHGLPACLCVLVSLSLSLAHFPRFLCSEVLELSGGTGSDPSPSSSHHHHHTTPVASFTSQSYIPEGPTHMWNKLEPPPPPRRSLCSQSSRL